jgi:hypothetical protein
MRPDTDWAFDFEVERRPQAAPRIRVGVWSRILSHAFFLLFTSPVLSPYVAEKTIYLFWFIPLFDPAFLRYLSDGMQRLPGQLWLATGSLMLWFLLVSPELSLRWALILWPLAYLWFAYEHAIFYLYIWMGFNVAVALVQAGVYWTLGPATAMLVGPKNIADVVWGDYATRSFTNFYSIVPGFDLPRFSGLSREGGFFAALLAVTVLLRVANRQRVGVTQWLGILLSISKSTAFLLIGWVATVLGMKDRRTPAVLFLPLLLAFCLLYYFVIDPALMEGRISATFTQRLYPYAALFHDMDFANLAVGNHASPKHLEQFRSFQLCVNVESYLNCVEMPSFAALIFSAGIVGMSLYVWQLSALGIGFWGAVLVFILTSNVSPLSNTSFVVLSYFLALRVAAVGRGAQEEVSAPAETTDQVAGLDSEQETEGYS